MKFLIASDLHGSYTYTKQLLQAFESEKADKLILLGDIYNHGPRNPLPDGYNPIEVAQLLNAVSKQLIVIRGNCDSCVDEMISNFQFIQDTIIVINNKTIYLQHVDKYNIDHLPKIAFDIFIYGHYHTGFIQNLNDIIIANTGSVSLPKNNTERSYLILETDRLSLKNLQGKVIHSINY